MSDKAATIIHDRLSSELLGGKVVDIGVQTDARQPYLCLLTIEKDGEQYQIWFSSPPKINGGY